MNILVVYYSKYDYPLRASTYAHLHCFKKYSTASVFYLNTAFFKNPWWCHHVEFDLIVFHTLFLSKRALPKHFRNLKKQVSSLSKSSAVKIALPQDEFFQTELLCSFLNDLNIDIVFSVAPKSEWSKIYINVDMTRMSIYEVLTGYLDVETVNIIKEKNYSLQNRKFDIVYRAWKAEYWLGRHGFLKREIGERANANPRIQSLITDISIEPEKTIKGFEWFDFLGSAKYTLGVEGGASILDSNARLREHVNDFIEQHSDVSFNEVEKHCFPGRDGELKLFALSPRHLEACLTKTCQILIEGNYNGILKPYIHYIPLKADFSNLDQVIDLVQTDHLRQSIVERAYQDIVASNQYTYRTFVSDIFERLALEPYCDAKQSLELSIAYYYSSTADEFAWICQRMFIVPIVKLIRGWFPMIFKKLVCWRSMLNKVT